MTSYWDRSGRIPVSNTFSNLSGPDPKWIIQQYWHIYLPSTGLEGCNSQNKGAVSAPRGLSSGDNRMKVVEGRVIGHWHHNLISLPELLQTSLIILTLMCLKIIKILAKFHKEGRLCALRIGDSVDGPDTDCAEQISPFGWLQLRPTSHLHTASHCLISSPLTAETFTSKRSKNMIEIYLISYVDY